MIVVGLSWILTCLTVVSPVAFLNPSQLAIFLPDLKFVPVLDLVFLAVIVDGGNLDCLLPALVLLDRLLTELLVGLFLATGLEITEVAFLLELVTVDSRLLEFELELELELGLGLELELELELEP